MARGRQSVGGGGGGAAADQDNDPFFDLNLPEGEREAQQRREQAEQNKLWLRRGGLALAGLVLVLYIIPALIGLVLPRSVWSRKESPAPPPAADPRIRMNEEEKKKLEQKIVALETGLKVLRNKAQKRGNERERVLQDLLDKEVQESKALNATVDHLAARQAQLEQQLASVAAETLKADALLGTLSSDMESLKAAAALPDSGLGPKAKKLLSHAKELQVRVAALLERTKEAQATACQSCPTCPACPEQEPVPAQTTTTTTTDCSLPLHQQAAELQSQADASKLELRRDCQREVEALRLTHAESETAAAAAAAAAILAAQQQHQQQLLQLEGRREPKQCTSSQASRPRPDFALRSAGGRIDHANTSQTYLPPHWRLQTVARDALESYGVPPAVTDSLPLGFFETQVLQLTALLGIDRSTGLPEDAISSDVSLGSCWPMAGQEGQLTVRLQHEVMVDAVSIQHIASQDAVDVRSAPRSFSVYGARDVGDSELLLTGVYELDDKALPLQTFALSEPRPASSIRLVITSNHGHPEYTCLYRVMVHGDLNN